MDQSLQLDHSRFDGTQVLWEDGERAFCRGVIHASGKPTSVLVMEPGAEHPSPAILDPLAHDFAFRNELDGAWAVRPLELRRERGRTMLVFEDPGAEPL